MEKHSVEYFVMDTQANKQLWDSVLVDIELSVSQATFRTWFRDTSLYKHDEGAVVVGVPNEFVRTWLLEKYHGTILKLLRERMEGIRTIEYIIQKSAGGATGASTEQRKVAVATTELPLVDHYVSKEDNLNSRYTFASFVTGPFNELAHAAAQAIVRKPGITYNPLFIYGDTGHGKTHLMAALGNAIKQNFPTQKVFYLTSEKFTMDYVSSLQNDRINAFKSTYRGYDVLIMDDIQFLSKKEKTQEEVFHLFNSLYDNNKQIVFSSDKHPAQIPDIEARLQSRFGAGMIVEITAPDHESRMAIIKSKAATLGFTPPVELIEYLATVIEGNVRELEGALNTIVCQTQLKGRELSLREAKNLIKETAQPKKVLSIKEVIGVVSSFYDLDEKIIYEKTRRKEVVKPRQIVMYLLREDFGVSYPTIGQKLGGRDHTTVIHSCDKVKGDLKNDMSLVHEIGQLRALLK